MVFTRNLRRYLKHFRFSSHVEQASKEVEMTDWHKFFRFPKKIFNFAVHHIDLFSITVACFGVILTQCMWVCQCHSQYPSFCAEHIHKARVLNIFTFKIWSTANNDIFSSHSHNFSTAMFNAGAAASSSVYT